MSLHIINYYTIFLEDNILIRFLNYSMFFFIIWRLARLNELTPIIFNMELTHLCPEDSIYSNTYLVDQQNVLSIFCKIL